MKMSIKRVLPLVCLSLLFSCQQNELSDGSDSDTAVDVTEFDLQNFSYDDLRSLLGNRESVRNVVFKDGEIVKEVKLLSLDSNVDLYDKTSEEKTFFFRGADTDSISVIMDHSYASVKFMQQGEELGYLAFVNPETAEVVISDYEEAVPATRTGAVPAITRSASRGSFKLNLTKLQKAAGNDKTEDSEGVTTCHAVEAPAVSEALLAEVPSAETRTPYYTQWPRGNTMTIHLERDTWDKPWEHEIDWQVSSMMSSIRGIHSGIKVKIWRSTTNFSSRGTDYINILPTFRAHCIKSTYPWKEAVERDIFFLVKHYHYRNAAGLAHLNTYKQSRYNNPYAFGFFACTILNGSNIFAHELGHILGAYHVPAHAWWKFWLKDDVMVPTPTLYTTHSHLNQTNRATIWDNLH